MRLKFYQLDEEFGERMNRISDERYFKYRRRILFLNNSLGRLYICYLGQFCQIDVYGGRQIESPSTKWRHKYPFNPRYSSTNKNRWWPPVILALFTYSCARLIINMYFQYIYDYHLFQYERHKSKDNRSSIVLSRSFPVFLSTSSDISSVPHGQQANSSLTSSNVDNNSMIARTTTAIVNNLLTPQTTQTAATTTTSDEYEQMLIRNVQAAKATLRSIGSPYIDLNFVIQIVYYILVTSSFAVLYIMKIYYDVNVFDYSLIRSLLDLKTERRVCNQLIRDEVNRFIYSSWNFTEACIEQSKQFAKEHLFYRHKFEQIYARAELQRFLLDHTLTIKQLEQMALNGILLPCSRTPEWVGRLTHWTCFWNLLILGYAFLVVIFFAFFVFYLLGIDIQFSTLDVLTIAEAGVLVAIILIAGVFYLSVSIISCFDQIYFVGDICAKIRRCIEQNRHTFYQSLHLMADKHWQKQQAAVIEPPNATPNNLLDRFKKRLSLQVLLASSLRRPQPKAATARVRSIKENQQVEQQQQQQPCETQPDSLRAKRLLQIESNYTQMNANLLEVLMLYKIFVAQVRPISRTIGAFGFACIVLMFSVPINTRLHSPYFDKNLKLYAMLFGLLLTSVADMALIPICYMYSECINIYRCLSSLMAHTVEITSHPMAGRIYDMHTVWLLRKELNHPERLTSQFTIHTLGINFTFANILRVHFWVGLISLSIIIDTNSNGLEFFGSVFNDPLGMFD